MAKAGISTKYELNAKSQKVFTVDSFRGVDYNAAQLQIEKIHAIDSQNMVYRDKVNQKRYGFEQIFKVTPHTYYVQNGDDYVQVSNPVNVNGVWKYVGEDNKTHIILHIGNILYSATRMGKAYSFLELKLTPIEKKVTVNLSTYNLPVEIGNVKSQAFVQNKRLYILTGTKFFVVKVNNRKLDVRQVEDDNETYIPKTTTGITYADSAVPNSTPLDDVNLMHSFRRNGLVSGTYVDDGITNRTTRFWDFQLDASVNPRVDTDINKIKITINRLKEVQ